MKWKDDKYYITEVLSGNTSLYRELVERHRINVFNIVFRIIQQREDAEEIAQDVFVRAFETLATFRAESKFSTWLYRIAYNMSVSQLRRKKIPEMPINEEILEKEVDMELFNDIDQIENWEHHLNEGLKTLDPEDLSIISMYYSQDLSTVEIADITGMSKSNVKIKLFRARKQLFDYISSKTMKLNKTLP